MFPVTPQAQAAADRASAMARGFETDPCPQCRNMALVRQDSILKCAACGELIVEISKSQWLRFIGNAWPDKRKVRSLLADNLNTMRRDWPPVGSDVLYRMLVEMGGEIEKAKTPEESWEAFFKVLQYLACPEPGHEALTLRVIDA